MVPPPRTSGSRPNPGRSAPEPPRSPRRPDPQAGPGRPEPPASRRPESPRISERRPEPPPASRRADPTTPATPGEILRAARLRRRISLADAELATRIRAQYLQALEDDDLGTLPAGVYSRGFMRNYAIFLGVPPDEVLRGMRDRRGRDRRPALRPAARPVSFRVPRATWLVAAVALAAMGIIAAVVWLGLTAPEDQRASSGAAVTPSVLVQLPPLATSAPPTPAPAAASAASAAQPSPTTAARAVEVEMRTTARTWIRATVDGKVALEDTLAAGQVQRWSGQQSVLLRVGNAGGVDVTVNGQRIGALGPTGAVIDREFTK